MTNPRLLRKIAKGQLDIVREYENKGEKCFGEFVVEKSTLAVVQQNPVTGRPEQSTWAVMETIYDDYQEHPELKINEKLQEVLNEHYNQRIL